VFTPSVCKEKIEKIVFFQKTGKNAKKQAISSLFSIFPALIRLYYINTEGFANNRISH